MRSILYYITSHGYGHAVRSQQVIRALHEAAATVQVHVRTAAPEWLFSGSSGPGSYTKQSLDVGVVQPNSLGMDLEATWRACRKLHDRMADLFDREIKFIKQHNIELILGDIPPICFEIAARASIPSVAITNFTWDVIYRAYTEAYPEFLPLIREMTSFYSKATLALALPYPCDMSMFPRCEPIPWVARESSLTRSGARAAFGLPQNRTIVLLSFGGLGFDDLPWQALDEMRDFFFVTTAPAGKSRGNLVMLDAAQRHYEDLLRAVEIIVTKPGYGIVADVLAQRLPVLYTERGEFPEYPFLVQALNDLATAEFIPQHELRLGNIRPYLLRLLEKTASWPAVPLNGAEIAAQSILALLEQQPRHASTANEFLQF